MIEQLKQLQRQQFSRVLSQLTFSLRDREQVEKQQFVHFRHVALT